MEEKNENEVVSREEFDGLKKDMNKSFEQIIELIKEKPKTVEEVKKVEAKKAVDKTAEGLWLYQLLWLFRRKWRTNWFGRHVLA